MKSSRGSPHSLPIEKWWFLIYCFDQFPSQIMLHSIRDDNNSWVLKLGVNIILCNLHKQPNQHIVSGFWRGKIGCLCLNSNNTNPWQALHPSRNHNVLHVTKRKVATISKQPIPTLIILLWILQAPPGSRFSEISYTFPGKSRLINVARYLTPIFLFRTDHFCCALLCQTASLLTSGWTLINSLLSYICDINNKQGQEV